MDVPLLHAVRSFAMQTYSATICEHMKRFYDSLSEKDRRRYAAVEAEKLGHGGVEYISQVLGCDPKTIRQGRTDVEGLPQDDAEGRVRKKGGASQS
jgi:hypothetical protein